MAYQFARSQEEQGRVERNPGRDNRHLRQRARDDQQAEQQLDPACNSDKGRVRDAQARGLEDVERRIAVEEGDGELRARQLLGEREHNQGAADETSESQQGRGQPAGIGLDGASGAGVVGRKHSQEQSDAQEIDALEDGDYPVAKDPQRSRRGQ
jgi:hypothetical protein